MGNEVWCDMLNFNDIYKNISNDEIVDFDNFNYSENKENDEHNFDSAKVLQSITCASKQRTRFKYAFISIVLLCTILPVSVYGIIKIKQYYFDNAQFTKYSHKISIQKAENNNHQKYKLEIDLPSEYIYSDILDKYYCGNRITGKQLDLKLLKVDKDQEWLENQVSNYEKLSVAGNEAFLYEKIFCDMEDNFIDGKYKLYIFFEEEGYVVCINSSATIDKTDFINYCNTITLKKCNSSEATQEYLLSEAMMSPEDYTKILDETMTETNTISGEKVSLSEWETYYYNGKKINVRINKTDILDSTAKLDKGKFFNIYSDCVDYNLFDKVISQSGEFTQISRLHIPKSDGINNIVRADKKDLVYEKLVYVTFEINSDELKENDSIRFESPVIMYLEDTGSNFKIIDDMYYYYDNIGLLKNQGLPVYSSYKINEIREYNRDVSWTIAGNSEISVGYLVDDDLLDNAYLCFKNDKGEISGICKILSHSS